LPEGFGDELSEANVGSTELGVYFLEELNAFGYGDAL